MARTPRGAGISDKKRARRISEPLHMVRKAIELLRQCHTQQGSRIYRFQSCPQSCPHRTNAYPVQPDPNNNPRRPENPEIPRSAIPPVAASCAGVPPITPSPRSARSQCRHRQAAAAAGAPARMRAVDRCAGRSSPAPSAGRSRRARRVARRCHPGGPRARTAHCVVSRFILNLRTDNHAR